MLILVINIIINSIAIILIAVVIVIRFIRIITIIIIKIPITFDIIIHFILFLK
jgi:hypothetical protein